MFQVIGHVTSSSARCRPRLLVRLYSFHRATCSDNFSPSYTSCILDQWQPSIEGVLPGVNHSLDRPCLFSDVNFGVGVLKLRSFEAGTSVVGSYEIVIFFVRAVGYLLQSRATRRRYVGWFTGCTRTVRHIQSTLGHSLCSTVRTLVLSLNHPSSYNTLITRY